jgi:hypothetical protein
MSDDATHALLATIQAAVAATERDPTIGSTGHTFSAWSRRRADVVDRYQFITAHPALEHCSFEEMRLADTDATFASPDARLVRALRQLLPPPNASPCAARAYVDQLERNYAYLSKDAVYTPLNLDHLNQWEVERNTWDAACMGFSGNRIVERMHHDALSEVGLIPELAQLVVDYVTPPYVCSMHKQPPVVPHARAIALDYTDPLNSGPSISAPTFHAVRHHTPSVFDRVDMLLNTRVVPIPLEMGVGMDRLAPGFTSKMRIFWIEDKCLYTPETFHATNPDSPYAHFLKRFPVGQMALYTRVDNKRVFPVRVIKHFVNGVQIETTNITRTQSRPVWWNDAHLIPYSDDEIERAQQMGKLARHSDLLLNVTL